MSKENGSLRQKVEDMDKKLDKAISLLEPIAELCHENANDIKWILRLGTPLVLAAISAGAAALFAHGNPNQAKPPVASR